MRPPADTVRARATVVGARLVVRGRPFVENGGELIIGDDVVIGSSPVPSHLVTAPGGRIVLGDGVRIGQAAAISASRLIDIGADAVLGSYVTIMDTDFHVAGDSSRVAAQLPVVVERRAFIGHRAILLPGSHVGAAATVAPGSVVSGTVLPGSTVAGNPAVHSDGDTMDGAPDRDISVGAVVASVFHLPTPAPPELGPDDIPAWDSLGALRLLLALEATFSIIIDEHELGVVKNVGDVERVVNAVRSRRTTPAY